jgi:hypothetical protein
MTLIRLSNSARAPSLVLSLYAVAALFVALPAKADLEIAGKHTSNVSCSAGVCQATAPKAVLNVKELQSYLASGDVTVSSVSQATAIDVTAPIHWTSHTLTLDSHDSITVFTLMTVKGNGGVSLSTNDGGTGGRLLFLDAGLTFKHASSQLTINGQSYQLEADLADLIGAVSATPGGNFALANDDDASGTAYTSSPIAEVDGNVNFLGHTISNMSISAIDSVGFVGRVSGTLASLVLKNVNIAASRIRRSGVISPVGGIVALNLGLVSNVAVTGTVSASKAASPVGGVVGQNSNTIEVAFSDVTVSGGDVGSVGGVVGTNFGTINVSAAIGDVLAGANATAGGSVGYNLGVITESLAWGNASGGDGSDVGGFVGDNYTNGAGTGTILDAYSIGQPTGTASSIIGTFAGSNNAPAPGGKRAQQGTTSFCYAIPTTGVALVGTGDIGGIKAISQKQLTKRGVRIFQQRQYWTTAPDGNPALGYLAPYFP